MLSEPAAAGESKHPYWIHEIRDYRGPSTRGKSGRSLRVTPQSHALIHPIPVTPDVRRSPYSLS